ncbi:MAG: formate dehydrogenase accessory sulfurtransferase FdhD [Psychromonas sp.]|nr:formate dehydrogenase accessory sulfurtransferase FdhD [Alteromonadales bacterium]MCP5077136.1 formate dehydrogenase accessory sulfurtransferase FdhD [Psychromonas sp.]
MHHRKEIDNPLAVQVMPKQHYQRQSDQSNKKLKQDLIIVEEPLQISLSYYDSTSEQYQTKILSITMRTPGFDRELIYGFLLCEGIIDNKGDIRECEFDALQHQGNAVCVILAKHVQPNWRAVERQFTSHSSCGICGKTSLNALQLKAPSTVENNTTINCETVYQLPELLREQQTAFSQTGGSHAAGLYCVDQFLATAEDIGRHNAVDKVIGINCLNETRNDNAVLVLSSRISFELLQKAIMANIHIIVAVGAPSALAVKAAKKFNITLIGFVKTDSFNVYHGDWRVLSN